MFGIPECGFALGSQCYEVRWLSQGIHESDLNKFLSFLLGFVEKIENKRNNLAGFAKTGFQANKQMRI